MSSMKNEWSSTKWAKELTFNPSLADQCPWEKFRTIDWMILLKYQPQFADKCNEWINFDGLETTQILKYHSQLVEYSFLDKLDGTRWAELLAYQPQLHIYCDWEKLWGPSWCFLIYNQFQFIYKCDWSKLSQSDWNSLEGMRSKIFDHCPDAYKWYLLCHL